MSHHHPPRRILTLGASQKRKEREAIYSAPPTITGTTTSNSKVAESVSSNRLLAGYMAYEYLTKGTLFGQKFDPARAEAVPLSTSGSAELKRLKASQSHRGEAEPSGKVKPQPQSYAEVATLLNSDGAHIPGIVNPTQLGRWIQM